MNKKDLTNRVAECMRLQDSFNAKVFPEWKRMGLPWHRAAWVEAGELMDHYGYKWWKKQEPNMEQVLLEIVDIFHFILSDSLIHKHVPDIYVNCFDRASRSHTKKITDEQKLAFVEDFVSDMVDERQGTVSFAIMSTAFGFNLDTITKYYIGKNTLNVFRQDNGYKDGTYIKVWNGKEDNEVLMEILNSTQALTYNLLYNELQNRYNVLTMEKNENEII